MIYFLQDPTTLEIKIGYSGKDEPDERIGKLQTGNPRELVLLLTHPGDRSFERILHKQFAFLHVQGEWFKPGPELLSYMLRSVQPAQPVPTFTDGWNAGFESGTKAGWADAEEWARTKADLDQMDFSVFQADCASTG